ncbi:unnamed protein product [Phytomonas sp. Hart1]|nr:unnamed protein product [Phytomonas sp. Hart1]|eukprot:CCW72040.1 unnamed protein product [Phytomonas sp. isolate Hart1]
MGGLAAETFAALDAMEENMRELGIDHEGAEDPVKGDSIANASSAYLKRIRARKDEQQKLRVERVLREFLAGSQLGEANDRPGPAEYGGREVANCLEEATALLQTERARAHHEAERRLERELQHRLRWEQIEKYRALDATPRPLPTEGGGERVPSCVLPPAVDCETAARAASEASAGSLAPPVEPADGHCRAIARGLVELAVCVSNNRFLDAEDIHGRPVRRLVQDLPVTTWRTWVRKYLWGLHDEAEPWRAHSKPGCEHHLSDLPSLEANSPSVVESRSLLSLKQRGEEGLNTAQTHLEFAAQQMGNHLSDMQGKAVEEILEGLRVEKERQRRSFLDDIRRRFDESQRAAEDGGVLESNVATSPDASNSASIGQNCGLPIRQKEAIPGWMYRMPPAGCFVFGDDLSGVGLCADNIEKAYTASVAHSSSIRRPSQAGGVAEELNSSFSIHNTTTPLGNVSFSFSKVEDGCQKIFLTPRIFQAAGRSPLTSRNRLGINNISNLKNIFRRASLHASEEDDHRELDTTAEQLCHELVNTHLHNLHVLTSGLVPAIRWTLGSPYQYKEQPHGGTPPASPHSEPNVLGDQMPPLRFLFLFNFPNSASFYRLLQQKMQVVLESAELFVQGVIQRQYQNSLVDSNPMSNLASPALFRGAGNYGSNKSRSTSLSNQNASQRSKGGRAGSARGKSIRNPTSVVVVDSNPKDDPASTQGPLVILPPLCVLGFFVEYTLPTRQRRLQEAYFHLPETRGGRNSDGTIDTVSSTNTGVSSQQVFHSTLRPEYPSTGLSAKEGNLTSPVRGGPAFPSGSLTQTQHPKAGPCTATGPCNGGANPKKSRTVRMASWSAACLRRELLVEDMNMRRWQEDWKNAFEPTTSAIVPEPTVTNNLQSGRGTNPNPMYGHSKQSGKRKPTNTLQSQSDASGANTSLQSEHEKSNPVPQGVSTGSECVSSAEVAATSLNFPRVLFFFQKEEVDFNTTPFKPNSNSGMDGTLWEESTKSPAHHMPENIDEKTKSSEYLISRITESLRNASLSDKLFTNESLCPHQLPPPLRLSDYRLSSSACGELVQAHRNHSTRSTPPPEPVTTNVDETTRIDVLQAEVNVFGCLMRFLAQLLHLLRDSALFRLLCCENVDDEMKQTDISNSTKIFGNSKTLYYSTVDRSFQGDQNIVNVIAKEYRQKLVEACCVWLGRQLVLGLETMAGGLEIMISELKRRFTGYLTPSTTEKESCAAPSLLVMLPVLDGGRLNELISYLIQASTPSDASCIFWEGLNAYFKDVEAAAVECVMGYLTSEVAGRVDNDPSSSSNLQVEPLNRAMLESLVPVMVKKLLAHLFALPHVDQSPTRSPPPMNFYHGEQIEVSSYITRCGDLLCEVVHCFNIGVNSCLDWLQGMYQAAINRPSDETCPILVRPRTVPEIFLPPASINNYGVEKEKGNALSGLNAWTHLNLKLFVTSFSIFGRPMLKENEFLYANVLTQLARIEPLLPSANDTPSESCLKDEGQGNGAVMETSGGHYWLDSFLLNVSCRANTTTPLSFLSLEEMQNLFRQTSKIPREDDIPHSADGGGLEPQILASARHFITNLALRRWCFCNSENPKTGSPCASVSAIPDPTMRELRAVILTLPAQLCCQNPEAVLNGETSGGPDLNGKAAWQSMKWWWLKSPITPANGGTAKRRVWTLKNEDLPLILLHLLRSDFVLARGRGDDGHHGPAYPPLRRVLKFVARVAYSKMATIERTFHTIAALQSRQKIGLRSIDRGSICAMEGGSNSSMAMAVDDLELNVETFCEFFSNGPEATKAPMQLECDVRLMLQWEGAQNVTLPLLLSSHWGRLVLANHALD